MYSWNYSNTYDSYYAQYGGHNNYYNYDSSYYGYDSSYYGYDSSYYGYDSYDSYYDSYFTPNYTNDDQQWGNYWEFRNWTSKMNFSDNFYSNYTEPEQGYGMPSKVTFSLDLGGFKTFGTEGQGNSSFG